MTGLVFWREGIDWNTTDEEHLDHAEQVLKDELVPHIKAFDSYPAAAMLEGAYVLSQAWNGDARVAVVEDPERYKWVLGAPKTELWIDTWAILADAAHPEAAHAWINYILEPENSRRRSSTTATTPRSAGSTSTCRVILRRGRSSSSPTPR